MNNGQNECPTKNNDINEIYNLLAVAASDAGLIVLVHVIPSVDIQCSRSTSCPDPRQPMVPTQTSSRL